MGKAKYSSRFTINLKKFLKVTVLVFISLLIISAATLFIFSKKYASDHKSEKIIFGVTFSDKQARKFNLNPDDVLNALLDDAGFKRFRLMSYWDEIENTKGTYDYSRLDSLIERISKKGGAVSLAIGLRQPRWPECFIPSWAEGQNIDYYENDLNNFIKNTVTRYKGNPSVISWQLENEFHLDVFGNCPDHNRRRLIDEYTLVKSIDTSKPVILTLANNYFGYPTGDPRPDIFGVSVYSKVFESKITNRYITYPFPSWYYGGRAGITELLTGRSSMLHELQLEPWGPRDIWEMTIEEQNKSMDLKRINRQLKFAEQTGLKPIDLWGAEWWYWRKTVHNDSGPWETIKNHIAN